MGNISGGTGTTGTTGTNTGSSGNLSGGTTPAGTAARASKIRKAHTTATTGSSGSGSNSTIWIVIVVVLVILLMMFLFWLFWRRRSVGIPVESYDSGMRYDAGQQSFAYEKPQVSYTPGPSYVVQGAGVERTTYTHHHDNRVAPRNYPPQQSITPSSRSFTSGYAGGGYTPNQSLSSSDGLFADGL
jgi:hypothetical protein